MMGFIGSGKCRLNRPFPRPYGAARQRLVVTVKMQIRRPPRADRENVKAVSPQHQAQNFAAEIS